MTARAGVLDNNAIAIGPELREAAAVAILAHGRGGSPADMRRLAVALATPAIRFILPAAPDGAWYPARFIAPIAENEPWLSRSLAIYAELVDGLIAHGVEAENIVIGGFSQGACLAAEFMVRHPRPYGAAVILTGGLIGPPGTSWPARPELRGVPVYLSGSKIDQWVPVERALETERVLVASGARVKLRIFEDRPHEVSGQEIAEAAGLLARWSHDRKGDNEN